MKPVLLASSWRVGNSNPIPDPYLSSNIFLSNFENTSGISGGSFTEESVLSASCTCTNMSTNSSSVNAKFNNSAVFNGTSSFINTTAGSDTYKVGVNTNFTIEGWIYPNSSATMNIFNIGNGTSGWFSHILLYKNGFGAFMYAVSNAANNGWQVNAGTNNSVITTSAWNHFAFVKRGTSYYTFINGILRPEATFTFSSTPGSPSTPKIYLGYQDNLAGSIFNGRMDSIRVSTTARYSSSFAVTNNPFPNT